MDDSVTVDEEGWSRGGRVVGMVGFHPLFMVFARGVVTGVSVGVFVLEGFDWLCLFGLFATWLLLTGLGVRNVQVPGRWR